jgi:hypothetical protein
MSSYDPFGHLKHKLWSKERPGIKLSVSLPTTKSQKSTRFTCFQVACHIPLESFWRGLQLFFRTHINRRFAKKVMGPQSRRSPKFRNFGTPTWESRDKMPFGCGPRGRHKVYYKGEGGGFPQVQAAVSLVSSSCPWLVLAPKALQLCTTHLVLVLCRSVWVVEAC